MDELREIGIGDERMAGGGEPIPPIEFPMGVGTDTYKAEIDGTEVMMSTTQQDGFTLASITDPYQYEYRVKVSGQGDTMSGIFYDPQTRGQVPVEWTEADGTLTLTLIVEGQRAPIEFTYLPERSGQPVG